MKLTVSKDEYVRISSICTKMMRGRAQLSAADWEKSTHKLVKELARKFDGMQEFEGEIEIPMARRHVRHLLEICNYAIKVVNEVTIPSYKARTDGVDYSEYIARGEQLIVIMEALIEKLEATL